jgi:hypothetical protein
MNNSKLLHQVLENINWDYVTRSFRGDVKWYGSEKVPTKNELIADLTEIVEVTFENLDADATVTQTVTPYWIVCIEEDEKTSELLLEVIFSPFAVFVNSKGVNKTKMVNSEKLRERLTIALRKENYELAGLIQDVLDQYDSKK